MGPWPLGVGDVYTCWNAVLTDDGNLTHVRSVTGNHLSRNSNVDIQGFVLEIDPLQLDRIPRGIETYFPNIAAIFWSNVNLTSITSEDLRPFPNLQLLGLWDNQLTSLDGDLFVHTPKIGFVNFQSNAIRNVGYGLLDGLNLTRAYFANNSCIDFDAHEPESVPELMTKLYDQCPPLMTTTILPTTTAGGSIVINIYAFNLIALTFYAVFA